MTSLRLLLILAILPLCGFSQNRDVWVVLDSQPVDPTVRNLRGVAEQFQAGIVPVLEKMGLEVKPFWISNRILVKDANPRLIKWLEALSFVRAVEPDTVMRIPDPIIHRTHQRTIMGVEPGVDFVRAPELWDQGIEGEGVLVAVIDTGVDPEHEALKHAWTGIWSDPSNVCSGGQPCDNNGHGTHVSGTILGSGGIGVAPKAKMAHCKGCESGSCSLFALMTCGEWVLTLNPAPRMVSNSWAGGPGQTFYRDILHAWTRANIWPIFAAGNSGRCDSIGSPGDDPAAIAVGAVTVQGDVATFSSLGPGRHISQKPDLVAPGVQVRSSLPNNNYASWSGTSMAAPHVAGVAALVLSAEPGLDVENMFTVLHTSSRPHHHQGCGSPQSHPNYVSGYGYLDAVEALHVARLLDPGEPPPPPEEPEEPEEPLPDPPFEMPEDPPGAPTELTARDWDGIFFFNWTRAERAFGYAVDLFRWDEGWVEIGWSASVRFSWVPPRQPYCGWFRVRAANHLGFGPESNYVNWCTGDSGGLSASSHQLEHDYPVYRVPCTACGGHAVEP